MGICKATNDSAVSQANVEVEFDNSFTFKASENECQMLKESLPSLALFIAELIGSDDDIKVKVSVDQEPRRCTGVPIPVGGGVKVWVDAPELDALCQPEEDS